MRFHHGRPPGSRYVKIMAPNPKIVDGMVDEQGGRDGSNGSYPAERVKGFVRGCTTGLGATGPVEFLP